MELTWHGHSTWHVSVGGTDLLIDPFFDNPKTDASPNDADPDFVEPVGEIPVHRYNRPYHDGRLPVVSYCRTQVMPPLR